MIFKILNKAKYSFQVSYLSCNFIPYASSWFWSIMPFCYEQNQIKHAWTVTYLTSFCQAHNDTLHSFLHCLIFFTLVRLVYFFHSAILYLHVYTTMLSLLFITTCKICALKELLLLLLWCSYSPNITFHITCILFRWHKPCSQTWRVTSPGVETSSSSWTS